MDKCKLDTDLTIAVDPTVERDLPLNLKRQSLSPNF